MSKCFPLTEIPKGYFKGYNKFYAVRENIKSFEKYDFLIGKEVVHATMIEFLDGSKKWVSETPEQIAELLENS